MKRGKVDVERLESIAGRTLGRPVLIATATGGALLACFVAGRWSLGRLGHHVEVDQQRAEGSRAIGERPRPRRYARALELPLAPVVESGRDIAPSEDGPQAEQARAAKAEFVIDQVFKRLRATASQPLIFQTPEAQANSVREYMTGLVEGAVIASPRMREAFSAQFTSALCDKSLADEEVITLAHLAMVLPDAPTPRSLDCFFSGSKKEDVPLWSMLDAWRNSGLEKTATLAKLETTSKDPRTARRFLSPEEAMRQRTPPQYQQK
jgi:hypothetical protein